MEWSQNGIGERKTQDSFQKQVVSKVLEINGIMFFCCAKSEDKEASV